MDVEVVYLKTHINILIAHLAPYENVGRVIRKTSQRAQLRFTAPRVAKPDPLVDVPVVPPRELAAKYKYKKHE